MKHNAWAAVGATYATCDAAALCDKAAFFLQPGYAFSDLFLTPAAQVAQAAQGIYVVSFIGEVSRFGSR